MSTTAIQPAAPPAPAPAPAPAKSVPWWQVPFEKLGQVIIDVTYEAPKRVAQIIGVAQVTQKDLPAIWAALEKFLADAQGAIHSDGLNFTIDKAAMEDFLALLAVAKQFGADIAKAV